MKDLTADNCKACGEGPGGCYRCGEEPGYCTCIEGRSDPLACADCHAVAAVATLARIAKAEKEVERLRALVVELTGGMRCFRDGFLTRHRSIKLATELIGLANETLNRAPAVEQDIGNTVIGACSSCGKNWVTCGCGFTVPPLPEVKP